MDLQGMMAQAKRMQRDIAKKKEEIDKMEFSGKSEWIDVVFTGDKKLKSLKITKDGSIEDDDKDILEDMLNIAIADAFNKIDNEIDKKLGAYGEGISGLL